jgi:hypothetical protein
MSGLVIAFFGNLFDLAAETIAATRSTTGALRLSISTHGAARQLRAGRCGDHLRS